MTIKFHLRLDRVTPEHIHQTVFANGRNCGKLVMDHGEYQLFNVMLDFGQRHLINPSGYVHAEVTFDPIGHDADGNFAMPEGDQK